MPTPIEPDDLAAALAAFAIEFMAALTTRPDASPEQMLTDLANGLDDLAQRMNDTPAATALKRTAQMLMASEIRL